MLFVRLTFMNHILILTSQGMSTIEQILQQERQKTSVDVQSLSNFLLTPQQLPNFKKQTSKEAFEYDFNDFNKSRVDLIKESIRSLKVLKQYWNFKQDYIVGYLVRTVHQFPYTIHSTMFFKCLQIMGTETQQQQWYKKAISNQIIGCYAQTQLGHGSDVQNLQTTATYSAQNDTFIINTPTISAAKYWPGDLGIFATHAMVFAQMIVMGKNHGVYAFIVPIRDVKTMEILPGIQVGDIGPKIGFTTKDNGYLLMKNIVIPKSYMLRRFVSVSKKGEIKTKGDPKVSYATMMVIRQTISCFVPKTYSLAIIIAARYSLFRKQFLDSAKKQIAIIDYQTQKQKIITRVAQYYAITLAGNSIKRISDLNLKLVSEKNDFSLMAETHVCLCLGKALFSEIVFDGMEICRRACGGHGFSHYSGLPNLVFEYASNLTYEGENTILYLQITRYLLKNYKYAMTKKKDIGQSVGYLSQFNDTMSARVNQDREDQTKWTLDDFQLLLKQSVCHCLSLVTQKMLNKEQGVSDLDVWNKIAGIQIKRVGMSHALLYTFSNFKKAVNEDKNPQNKKIITALCLLFGVHIILNQSASIAEGGFLLHSHITSLLRLKQILLQQIRPQLIGVLDSFLIPQHLIRSAFTKGNPYDNMLQMARKCELNKEVSEAALFVRNNIQRVIKMHQSKL